MLHSCYTMLHFCYTFPSGLSQPVAPSGHKRSRSSWGGFFRLNSSPLLLPIRLSVARFTQQGGDEVDYFLVRKDEFQGAKRPLQYSFHSNISIKLFGAKVRSPGVAAGSASGWRQMAAVMCGYRNRRRRKALRQNGAYS